MWALSLLSVPPTSSTKLLTRGSSRVEMKDATFKEATAVSECKHDTRPPIILGERGGMFLCGYDVVNTNVPWSHCLYWSSAQFARSNSNSGLERKRPGLWRGGRRHPAGREARRDGAILGERGEGPRRWTELDHFCSHFFSVSKTEKGGGVPARQQRGRD